MPSKDMSEILSRCRTGDSAAQEPLALQPIHEVLGIDDCEQVSNIFAYNPTTGDRIPNDEVEWTVSDPTVVTYDPVNGAVSSASRKNKGASIAMRGSPFWVK